MTISAIVPAAGCGARAALNGNKILAPLLGRPVLAWTIEALTSALSPLDDVHLERVIVAARSEEFELISEHLQNHPRVDLVEGGATRQDSVFNAVQHATTDYVLVHDAARPCVAASTIEAVVAKALETGAAIAALPVSDTVKQANSCQNIAATLDRNFIWLAQTPQVFQREWFLAALHKARTDGFSGTDCASIMEYSGRDVALVEGDSTNLKITYAPDLERAATILKAQTSSL